MNNTPKAITPQILELCKRIDATQTPVFVPVMPVSGTLRNECFPNVQSHIKQYGGAIQYGWMIWEYPIGVEGVFHACWVDTSGQLVDITAKDDGETKILFLPDSKKVYEGIPIDNVRQLSTKNPVILRGIRFEEEFHKVRVKHNIDGRSCAMPDDELLRLSRLAPSRENFIQLLCRYGANPEHLESLLNRNRANVGRNDACPCGSGAKFKRCCGR